MKNIEVSLKQRLMSTITWLYKERIIRLLNCYGAEEERPSALTLIESSSHSPENVPKRLHFCGYHHNYHVASTGRPCLEDVKEHGEPIGGGKRDGGGSTGDVWEPDVILITCQP